MTRNTYIVNSEQETKDTAKEIVKEFPKGSTFLLRGDLGAGKTTFVRGVAEFISITEKINSPTFNIMKLYLKGTMPLVHIDAYRLEDKECDIGLDEYIGIENGLTFIEWPDYIKELLPKDSVCINIRSLGDNKREIEVIKND